MAHPTPLRSFLGGLGIPVAAHELLVLNGNVFGISGFVHRGIRGSIEGLAGVAGLVLSGAVVANLEGNGPVPLSLSLPKVLLSGFLVGLGTKLANGCTSGHMICGVSRFSLRSIAATATFFTTGVISSQIFHRDLPATSSMDWSLGPNGANLIALQAIPLSLSLILYALNPNASTKDECDCSKDQPPNPPRRALRALTFVATALQFGFALRLSNLTEATRVLSFLLPIHPAFDPSLAFLAAGALPLGMFLYHYMRGSERPCLGGDCSVPKGGEIDARLLIGSSIFGVGWGLAGICPGPALVNFGRALGAGGQALAPYASWIASMLVGGLLA
ncbi:unnamed protein product [Cyclocybe aegerita]|uniref:Sulphur transport domain-containing protein n=1 Tax=Cyclocybe aegerita TaxID=1973307 RepID=A0A8S0W1C8_CYCAE|nr:unnamed protein product [Cyclocybe aegerita]